MAEFKGVKLKLDYRMTNAEGQEVCEAHSEHCFLDRNGMPVRLAKKYPDFYRTLTELAAGEGAEQGQDRGITDRFAENSANFP